MGATRLVEALDSTGSCQIIPPHTPSAETGHSRPNSLSKWRKSRVPNRTTSSEYRRAVLVQAIERGPALLDRLYRMLPRRSWRAIE